MRPLTSISFHSKAHQIAVAVIIASILQGLLIHSGADWLLFAPFRVVFSLEVWRPFTALLISTSPAEIIFGTLIIYSIGGALEARWPKQRFLKIIFGIPLAAEALVSLLAAVFGAPLVGAFYTGARLIITTLWIIFGLEAHFSRERLNFWGTPITGKTFALIGLGFVVLSAVFAGPSSVLPDLFTALFCYLYMYRYTFRRYTGKLKMKFYEAKLKKLKGRGELKVIRGFRDRNDDEPGPQIH
jgi:membrane associated rhomboid family serine protease